MNCCENSICHSYSTAWRMAPPIAALISSISGIVFAIFWNYLYLTIPFTLGVAGSIYSIHLAYRFKDLKTLSQNNALLKTSVDHLAKENTNLEHNVTNLKSEVEDLKSENQKFCQYSSSFQESMTPVCEALSQNYQTFHDKLKNFSTEVGLLESRKQKHSDQLQKLIDVAQSINTLFKAILIWKDNDSIQKQLQMIDNLQRKQLEMEAKIGERKGLYEATGRQLEYLEKIVNQIQEVFQQMHHGTNEQGAYASDLKSLINNVANKLDLVQIRLSAGRSHSPADIKSPSGKPEEEEHSKPRKEGES